MRIPTTFRLGLAAILAIATAGAGAALAGPDDDDTATPTTAPAPVERAADTATDLDIDDKPDIDDVDRHDPALDTTTATTGERTMERTRSDTPMSERASSPMAFDLFDQRWCVGDGVTPLACDVRVVPPGPDAFTMFGQTWCLNDAPGRACDVRVRGDGVIDDDDDLDS